MLSIPTREYLRGEYQKGRSVYSLSLETGLHRSTIAKELKDVLRPKAALDLKQRAIVALKRAGWSQKTIAELLDVDQRAVDQTKTIYR